MWKKSYLFTFTTLFSLIFPLPQAIASQETVLESSTPRKTAGIQLKKMSDDTLEAVLATGNDALLKLRMSLKELEPFDKGQVEVPAHLFLTDFTSAPTSHSPVAIRAKVDCDPIEPTLVLPSKPQSFDSYDHFVEWLQQGYLTNELRITYDFTINPHSVASSLLSDLYHVSDAYHFIGTHILPNAKIVADTAIPKASYLSQRGSINKTTVTLSGTIYHDKKPYPIDDHQQFFPHTMIRERVLKLDRSKRFYCPEWMSQGEEIVMATYQEFPTSHFDKWPEVPSSTYSIAQRRIVDRQNLTHLACLDGSTGEEIDISEGKAFWFECEGEKEGDYLVDIVKDKDDRLYIVKYLDLALEEKRKEEERKAEIRRQFMLTIPIVARGYEEIYQRFLKGVLVYRPKSGSEEGRIDLPIASLLNPLEGMFDLSQCGDASKYLSISTGYRKGKKIENEDKVEIWLTPRFLVEKEIQGEAQHLQTIFPNKWPAEAPIGIFWNWGGWNCMSWYNYLTEDNFNNVSNNLYNNRSRAQRTYPLSFPRTGDVEVRGDQSMSSITIHFLN